MGPSSRFPREAKERPLVTMGQRSIRTLQNVTLLISSLAVAELALQLVSSIAPSVDLLTRKANEEPIPQVLPDERLGYRGNPAFPEHDGRGFRNSTALDRADIVTLGDSQTYGTGVGAESTWPAMLSTYSHRTVYNLAFPGYGPAQALENLPLALGLDPTLVVFGLYFGNDFSDDFGFAKRNASLDDVASEEVLAEIVTLEERGSIESEVSYLFRQGGATPPPPRTSWLRDQLSDHSRLYGVVRAARARLTLVDEPVGLLARDFDKVLEGLTPGQRGFVSVYEGPTWRTVLTSTYRARVLDWSDPRIRTGVDITKAKLAELDSGATLAGAKFVVVLIPTKEFVFWPKVAAPADHPSLTSLVRDEAAIRDDIITFMRGRDIAFVDAAPDLRGSPQQPYYENGDGHPNAMGHQVIARTVARFVDHASPADRNAPPAP